MANHKSASKRNRQRIVRTTRNHAFKSQVRSALKNARLKLIEDGQDATSEVKHACTMLDCAASKNVLPFKRVARLKSRLAVRLNKQS